MKKKNATRVIAIVLVLLMALALIPFAASAAGQYSVTFMPNGATGTAKTIPTHDSGFITILHATDTPYSFSNPGHAFLRWNSQADGSGFDVDLGEAYPTDNWTLYALWKSTLTLKANGGTGSDQTVSDVTGKEISLSSYSFTPPEGCSPSGWNTAADGSGTPYGLDATFTLSDNSTLYAQYSIDNPVTISFNANGGTLAPAAMTVPSGVTQNLPTTKPLRSNYVFQGWDENPGAQTPTYTIPGTITVTQDTTLYAVWKADTVAVNYVDQNGANPTTPVQQTRGGSFQLESKTKYPVPSGMMFEGWLWNGDLYDASSYFTVPSDPSVTAITFQAQYAEKATASFVANGGSVSPANIEAPIYSTITLPTPTRTKYSFQGWFKDVGLTNGPFTGSYALDAPNTTFFAKWISEGVTIHFNANGGTGTPMADVTPTRGTQYPMPSCSYTAPDENKVFSCWKIGSDSYKAAENYPVPTDGSIEEVTAIAQWVDKITVTFDPKGGTVVPTSKKLAPGDAIGLLPVPTRTDYEFAGWYKDEAYTEANKVSTSTTFDSSTTVYAKWNEKVTITFDAKGGTPATQTKSIVKGAPIGALPSATKEGSNLVGWYKEEDYLNKISEATTFDAAATVYAKWLGDTVTVVFNANGGTGAPVTQNMSRTAAMKLKTFSATGFIAPVDKSFKGWARTAGATDPQFTDAESVVWDGAVPKTEVELDTVTLYAVWGDKLAGNVEIYKGETKVTGGTVQLGDTVEARTDLTENPLYYRWYLDGPDGPVVVGTGKTYKTQANDAQTGWLLCCEVSADSEFTDSINGPDSTDKKGVTVVTDQKVNLTVTVSGVSGTSKLVVAGVEYKTDGSTTVQVVKGADVEVQLVTDSNQSVKSVKKNGAKQTTATSYTWQFTANGSIEVVFGPKGGTKKTLVIDKNADISAAEARFQAKLTADSSCYAVYEYVACWDNNPTNKLTQAEIEEAGGFAFKIEYPANSNKIPVPGSSVSKDISKAMTTYYHVDVYHDNGSVLVPVSNCTPNATFSSGISVPAQTAFSPYGAVLTPMDLKTDYSGTVNVSGTKSGKGSVGAVLTASFSGSVEPAGKLYYQWQVQDGSMWKNLTGEDAKTASYTPKEADKGKTLRCVITSSFETGSVASAEIPIVEKPNPVVLHHIINDGNLQKGAIGNVTSGMQYIQSDTKPTTSTPGWKNITGSTIQNLTVPGSYYVRSSKESDAEISDAVVLKSYYTVTCKPDSISVGRLYFTAGGTGVAPYDTNIWVVENGGSITVVADSANTTYYKITNMTRQMSYVPYTQTSQKFNNTNSGSMKFTVKDTPYVVYASAGVYGSKTGDNSHLELWMELAALSLMGLCAVAVFARKKLKKQ